MHPWVAAAAEQAPDALPFDITQVLQFGLLGLIFLCIVFRKFIVPEWTLKEQEERSAAEKAELVQRLNETRDQLESLQKVFQDRMIPALTMASDIATRYTDELQKARYSEGKKPE